MEIKNATAANWIPGASTAQLRDAYLLDSLFATGELRSVYAHEDRMVVGAAVPAGSPLKLEAAGPVRAEYFLQRRELGVVKVGGGPGTVVADGTHHVLEHRDCLYLGQGMRSVEFVSADPSSPARFYFVSTPAYRPCPAQKIAIAGIEPITLGSAADANHRLLYKCIHEGTVDACQLVMGVTVLQPGSIWNTMPPHLHDRRSEVYLYFDLAAEARVIHLMGEPAETRHLIMRNEEAVISPRWSIHAGAGTGSYAFCWAMGGENRTYDDIDRVPLADLR